MIVLGLDALSPRQSAAVWKDGEFLARAESGLRAKDLFSRRSDEVLPVILRAVGEARIAPDDIEFVAATIGPGSYTGIRIGLATLLGFFQGRPVKGLGVNTLAALEELSGAGLSLVQTKRNEWFAKRKGNPEIFLFTGKDPLAAPADAIAVLGEPPPGLEGTALKIASSLAEAIVERGLRMLESGDSAVPLGKLAPLYPGGIYTG